MSRLTRNELSALIDLSLGVRVWELEAARTYLDRLVKRRLARWSILSGRYSITPAGRRRVTAACGGGR